MSEDMICPHCDKILDVDEHGLIPYHDYPPSTRQVCPGSKQSPIHRTPVCGLASCDPWMHH